MYNNPAKATILWISILVLMAVFNSCVYAASLPAVKSPQIQFFEIYGLSTIPYYLLIAKDQVDWIQVDTHYLFIYQQDANYNSKSMFNWLLSQAKSGIYYGSTLPKAIRDFYGLHPHKGDKHAYTEHIGRVIKNKNSRHTVISE
jgi:hypothetical protein